MNLTQTEFGERIGVKGNTITNYENGLRTPSDAVIHSICREFNINKAYLLKGIGEMFVEVSREDKIRDFVDKVISEDDAFKKRFVEMLADLDTDDWVLLQKVAEKLANPSKRNVDVETEVDLGASAVIKPYDGPKKEVVDRILREDVEEEFGRINTELTARGYIGNDDEKATKKGRNN